MRRLLVLALVVPMAAACGGGGSSGSGNPVADAASKTVDAGTELSETSSKVSYPEQTFSLAGDGGFNHVTSEGWQQLTLKTPATKLTLDEIFIHKVFWLKSNLFNDVLPSGKEWLKVDTAKTTRNTGFNFKGLWGQTSADVLDRLQHTAMPVKTIGKETVDGIEMTHYRATVDPKQLPKPDRIERLTAPAYKPIDVWVDGDDHVRQVKLDFTTKAYTNETTRAHVLMTMKLSDFGATVDVESPAPSTVVDATAPAATG